MPATIEDVRAYWDAKPCDSEQSLAPMGTRAYFAEVERRKYEAEPHIPGFADFARWRGKRVLEIGCGVGTDSVNFARAGADVTVVDLSPRSLELARRHFEAFGLKGTFHCGNAEALDRFLPAQTFDLIYSYGVIHHAPHPERILRQLRAYCGPHTELRLMLYATWSTFVLFLVLKQGRGAFWRARWLVERFGEAEEGCPVTFTYTRRGLRRLLDGYQILSARKAGLRLPGRWARPRGPLLRAGEHLLGWDWLIVARPREGMR